MGILEGIFYTMWRGLAIGIIISAPMGPVGILCVQRTLDKGRRTGLYTGVGAAISDLLYCLLTGFGLSFIEEFLERNSNIIQLLGSVVLIGFGIYLFKSNPSRKLKKPSEQRIPAGKNILNGFLFTVSNPLIIFLIIGLFARFNFLMPEIKFYHYIIGFIFIFLGALLWWYFVTYFVDKVRAHFNLRSMWMINKIIGSVIFLFAIVGIITAVSGLASAARPVVNMNSVRGFGSFRNATDSSLIIDNGRNETVEDLIGVGKCQRIVWQFRTANLHAANGKGHRYEDGSGGVKDVSYPGWGIVMKGSENCGIFFRTVDDRLDETYSSPHVEMTVKVGGNICTRKDIFSDFNLYDGENAFRIYIDKTGWKLKGGNRTYKPLAECDIRDFHVDSIGYAVMPGGCIRADYISVDIAGQHMFPGNYVYSGQESIWKHLERSSDEMEGIWGVYDRMLEENYMRLGGEYRVAFVKSDSGYDIIYIDGAVKNPGEWKQGMKKGRLVATPFENVYNVEWVDSSGYVIEGAKAQFESPLLRIVFPDHSSELRLSKIRNNRVLFVH